MGLCVFLQAADKIFYNAEMRIMNNAETYEMEQEHLYYRLIQGGKNLFKLASLSYFSKQQDIWL